MQIGPGGHGVIVSVLVGFSVTVCHPEFYFNIVAALCIGLEKDPESAVRQGFSLSCFQNQVPVGCSEGLFILARYTCFPLDTCSPYGIAKRGENCTGAFGLSSLDGRSEQLVKFEFQKVPGVRFYFYLTCISRQTKRDIIKVYY